jgi:hypothetical protein
MCTGGVPEWHGILRVFIFAFFYHAQKPMVLTTQDEEQVSLLRCCALRHETSSHPVLFEDVRRTISS